MLFHLQSISSDLLCVKMMVPASAYCSLFWLNTYPFLSIKLLIIPNKPTLYDWRRLDFMIIDIKRHFRFFSFKKRFFLKKDDKHDFLEKKTRQYAVKHDIMTKVQKARLSCQKHTKWSPYLAKLIFIGYTSKIFNFSQLQCHDIGCCNTFWLGDNMLIDINLMQAREGMRG